MKTATLRGLGGVALLVAGCTGPLQRNFSIRFDPGPSPRTHRSVPAVGAMGCYFLTSGNTGGPMEAPTCLGLGRSSALFTFAQLTGQGVPFRVPAAGGFQVRLWGVWKAEDCAGRETAEDLFRGGLRPSLFVISEARGSLLSSTEMVLPNKYVPGTNADEGSCEAPAPTLTTLNPSGGLHRGGWTMDVAGSGFKVGAKVSVEGTLCTETEYVSDSLVRCTTPSLVPGALRVVKGINPNGATGASETLFDAMMFVTTGLTSATSEFTSYAVNPTTGALGAPQTLALAAEAYQAPFLLHPSGKWAFALRQGSPVELVLFRVNLQTGRLSVQGFVGVEGAQKMQINPDGKWIVLYRSSPIQKLTMVKFDAETETLTLETDSAEDVFSAVEAFAFNPQSDLIYVSVSSESEIRRWSLDTETGALTERTSLTSIHAKHFLLLPETQRLVFPSDIPGSDFVLAKVDGQNFNLLDSASLAASVRDLDFRRGETEGFLLDNLAEVVTYRIENGGVVSLDAGIQVKDDMDALFSGAAFLRTAPNGNFLAIGAADSFGIYSVSGSGVFASAPVDFVIGGSSLFGLIFN